MVECFVIRLCQKLYQKMYLVSRTRDMLNLVESNHMSLLLTMHFHWKNHIMKPYALRNVTIHQWDFNYHLSRARRMVKNAFGILNIRFRVIFESNAAFFWEYRKIVLASCVLHNFQVTFSLSTITKVLIGRMQMVIW